MAGSQGQTEPSCQGNDQHDIICSLNVDTETPMKPRIAVIYLQTTGVNWLACVVAHASLLPLSRVYWLGYNPELPVADGLSVHVVLKLLVCLDHIWGGGSACHDAAGWHLLLIRPVKIGGRS